MPKVKIPKYKDFKKEIFDKINSDEKNLLFYWSLTDISSWEEVPPLYYPNSKSGHGKVIYILKKSPEIKKYIEKDGGYFMKRFVMGEFLTNYLLAAELELMLGDKWDLDLDNLHQAVFPDIVFRKGEEVVSVEVKGMISASNLKQRINDDVIPNLRGDDCDNFLLLLLFLVCPNENPDRVNQLIEGYYVYEALIAEKEKRRQVFCQCFTEEKDKEEKHSLERLANRIVDNYFSKT